MNTILWLIAGAGVAAGAFHYLNLNGHRGLVLAVIIGVVSAYFGGSILAPIIDTSGVEVGDFNPFALLIASCTALAALYLSDGVYERFGT